MATHFPSIWRQILKNNFTQWQKLADYLELSEKQRAEIDTAPDFILNLPQRLASKIAKGDLNDPLLRQFLPTIAEKRDSLAFVADPTGDSRCQVSSKLLQKYQGRALLLLTSGCAMHCRYCFRQNFDYDREVNAYAREIELLEQDSDLREVILSGGDPLSLSNSRLEQLMQRLAAIAHLKRLRIHTRFPIGIPERIDAELLRILEAYPLQQWWVIHSNHPRELDDDVLAALSLVRRCGVVVMNQAVLLRGVNDDIATLQALSERLVDHGILPYYLHQLDRVKGASHFEVPVEEGRELIAALRARLSGYAIPNYVAEIYGEPSKTPL